MIDYQAEVDALMHDMEANLPIPVKPTSQLERDMQRKGKPFSSKLSIHSIFYAGDDGGIMCAVTPPDTNAKEVVVVSLTHL